MTETVLIYTSASPSIGHGHIMRAIALAREIRDRGLVVEFVSTDAYTSLNLKLHDPSAVIKSSSSGSEKYIIRDVFGGSDLDVVSAEVDRGVTVLLLDDSGPAHVEASIVSEAMMTPDRIPASNQRNKNYCMYGLDYSVLRQEFFFRGVSAGFEQENNPRIALALGGGFDDFFSTQIIKLLYKSGFKGEVDVILPQENAELLVLSKEMNITLHVQALSVSDILSEIDLVITKLGVSMLESFSMGCACVLAEPSLAHLSVQNALSRFYVDWPAIETGIVKAQSADEISKEVMALIQQPEKLALMKRRAHQLVDGKGARRLINALLEYEV